MLPGSATWSPSPTAFLAEDLFRRAVLSRRIETDRDPARFATVDGLWADLLDRHQRTPSFRLVRDGVTLPPASTTRSAGVGHQTLGDVVQPNRVVEHYQSGATLVLQGLQLTVPHLGRFANNLALALDQPVQINAYLTPAGTKGLELHFDFHDVFVVQLDGRKRWRVWAPLDRTARPVRDGARPPMPTWDEVGEPLLDVTLEAGDCLYLPRGFPHAAEALASSSSHLTVGVMARTWQQAVRHALDDALTDPELRASIPLGALESAGAPAPDLQAVLDALDPARTRAWLAAETWRRQPSTRRRPLVAPIVSINDPVDVTPGSAGVADRRHAPAASRSGSATARSICRTRRSSCSPRCSSSRPGSSPATVESIWMASPARSCSTAWRPRGWSCRPPVPSRERPGRRRRGRRRASSARWRHANATSRCSPRRPRCGDGCWSRCAARGAATRWPTANSATTPRPCGAGRWRQPASVSSPSVATSTTTRPPR